MKYLYTFISITALVLINIATLAAKHAIVGYLSPNCNEANGTLSVQDQLEKLNKCWENKNLDYSILEERIPLTNDVTLIQMHLSLVEKTLRNKSSEHLSSEQKQNREKCLDTLHNYWTKGIFPKNLYHKERTPYFIDDFGTACAVGQLIISTGHVGLANKISKENNYAYIKNMSYPELITWANLYGFTIDELKWIQPTYGGCVNSFCPNDTQKNVTCYGGTDGCFGPYPTHSLLISPFTYQHYYFNPITNTWVNQSQTCDLSAGTYKVVVTDAGNNTEEFIYNITQPSPLSVTINATPNPPVICVGEIAALTANATGGVFGYAYLWNSGETGNAINVSPVDTTTYEVVVTDANGCTNTVSTTVTVNPLPNVNASTTPICLGDVATFNATGTTSYSWTGPNGYTATGNAVTASPATAGTYTYTVTGTDANGCMNIENVLLTVNALPVFTASAILDTICIGQAATLSGSDASLTYYYTETASGATVNSNVSPATTTGYTITGTDGNGCVSTANVTVVVRAPLTVTVSPDTTICTGGSATLTAVASGGEGNYFYSWSPASMVDVQGNTVNTNSNLDTTTTLTVTIADGCGSPASVQVVVTVTDTCSPPLAPSNLTITPIRSNSGRMMLTWQDNSNNENGFGIQRSNDNITFINTDSVSTNVTSYTDTGLVNNAVYYYRVFAYNAAGSSAVSNTVTETTLTGIADLESKFEIKVYPNPFSTSTTIEIKNAELKIKNFTVSLFDLLGKEVKTVTTTSNQYIINRDDLSQGIYIYKVASSEGIIGQGKLIIR